MTPATKPTGSPSATAIDGGDGAFGGDDRRDDRDLADAQRRVGQLESDDVADPGDAEQAACVGSSVAGRGADDRDREADDARRRP